MSAEALARLGMNPDRVRGLLDRWGSPSAVLVELGVRRQPETNLAEIGARFLQIGEPGYPSVLGGLPDAPLWLFVRGAVPAGPMVAVVGSRRPTSYGMTIARTIGAKVAAAGWPVVSGLAAGIDGAAHRGCLEVGGTAVAVLGSGIDVWYPARHRALGQEILDRGGAVISEFGPGILPEAWRFPCRNRIISGVSLSLVVVEAAVQSGALITARMAVEQGRDVFAVPGDLGRPTSEGCNLLIRDGAHPITDLDHLVEELEFVLGAAPTTAAGSTAAAVLGGLVGEIPVSIETILAKAGRPVGEIMAELGRYQATGAIVIEGGMARLL